MFLRAAATVCFFFVISLSCLPAFGQQSQVQFGKNRIQYKDFTWKYISTYNFDVYYYGASIDIAKNAATYAESDYQRIIDQTGFTPYSKIKILIYNSMSDMQQSNIGLEDESLLIGGQTNFVKSKIEVAFKGDQNQFRKDISYSVSAMIINIMLYGGSLKDIVQSSYLLSLPEWYVNGAAAYISEGWGMNMDDYVRDMFANAAFKKPSMLTGREATLIGQSIWNFIAEKYGKPNIGNILNLTRILRNEEASIESTLGVPYSVFIKEWISYYSSITQPVLSAYEKPSAGYKIFKRNYKDYGYKNLSLSPDGKKLSYLKTYQGKYKVLLYDTETGKKKILHKGGAKLRNQQADENAISLAWQSSEMLAYIEKRRNKTTLNFVNINNEKTIRRKLNEFNQVLSFSFSGNGDKILLSADKNGQSDIFLYSVKDNSIKQLTNDLYDDLHPVFLKNGQSFAFSSNRLSDTLNKTQAGSKDIKESYNIFIHPNPPVLSRTPVLKRITNYAINSKPLAYGDEILFLSNEKGINNIYKYDPATGIITQVSKFLHDLDEYDVDDSTGSIAFSSLDQGHKYVYYIKDFSIEDAGTEAVLTERQKLLEEKNPRPKIAVVADSVSLADSTDSDTLSEEININDYKFESDVKAPKQKQTPAGQNYFFNEKQKKLQAKDEIKIKGPSKYRNDFGVERVNSTLMIDPLRGLGILMEANMADMMGNHRMNAGLFGLTDLKSSNIFGEYMYLKKRIDYKARFDRTTIYAIDEANEQRYTMNKGSVSFSYPFTVTNRISFSPHVMNTRFTNLTSGPSTFLSPDKVNSYLGGRAEFVHDNSSVTGMNMIEGTRFKIGFEYNAHTRNNIQNFGKLILDLRHYQRIHKELILATRLSYGKFFGPARKNFLLGGMDNWLFNSTSRNGERDPLALNPYVDNSDLLFVEYVTSMRGFNYSTQYGSQHLLFNAEFRVPIVKYLYRGVVGSNFLKNFQLVGFTDVGSCWSGASPFGTDNSTNTTVIGGGSSPFVAKVTNYKNPFLIGYGLGARTLFLGYYVKFDVAWGLLNNQLQDRMYYLTFGYDF